MAMCKGVSDVCVYVCVCVRHVLYFLPVSVQQEMSSSSSQRPRVDLQQRWREWSVHLVSLHLGRTVLPYSSDQCVVLT